MCRIICLQVSMMCSPCRSNIAPLLQTESEELLKMIPCACTAGNYSLSTPIRIISNVFLTLLNPMFRCIIFAALGAGILAQSTDACRFKNGTALPSEGFYDWYQPCPGSSVCCALNRDNAPGGNVSLGLTRDECLPNGLCQNRATGRKVATQWVGAVVLRVDG
jgi:hypothetical protein